MTALAAAPAAFAAALASRQPGPLIVAEPQGAGLASRLATLTDAARVHAHITAATSLDGIPVLLAETDRDIAAHRPAGWPAAPARHWLRHRRIDTLYAGQPIAGIVLADAASAPAILRGAARVLADAQPWVLLCTRTPPAIPSYRWDQPAPGLAWARPTAQTAAAPRLPKPRPTPIIVPFDQTLVCAGLHLPEPNAPAGGRWTGAAYATWFTLPRPLPGQWRLRLDIADWGNAPDGFATVVDGATLQPQRQNDALSYGPVPIAQGPLTLRVALLLPRAERDLIRWPRRIGVRIRSATLLPA